MSVRGMAMGPCLTFCSVLALGAGDAAAQSAGAGDRAAAADLRAGRTFLPTEVHSGEEDRELLALFDGLRVADVADGMDAAGLPDVGRMDPEIRPLWRDTEKFTHRFAGIAVTARYVPTQDPRAGRADERDHDRWVGAWYANRSSEPFTPILRAGTALVIDDASEADVGSIGSNNIMSWRRRGVTGVVTNATARDTDEIAAEKVPLYFRKPGRGIRPGRNEIESVNRPLVCGGVLVRPGDVVLGDGDGVIVVPRARAAEVAVYARRILEEDKAARRRLYEELGLPLDDSVRWRSLFDGVSLGRWRRTDFGGQGEVRAEGGKLILAQGEPMTGVTWTGEFPKVDFEIRLEAMRAAGSDFFCGLTFPVGEGFASLILGGWGGGVCGISSLDGMDASENETSSFQEFESGRWYRVRLRVTEAKIEAWLDDRKIADVTTTGRRIDVRSDIALAKPLGLSTWRTTGVLRNIRWERAAETGGN